jgi:hypothetical protein
LGDSSSNLGKSEISLISTFINNFVYNLLRTLIRRTLLVDAVSTNNFGFYMLLLLKTKNNIENGKKSSKNVFYV